MPAFKFIRLWIFLVAILTTLLLLINILVDPMWLFSHSNGFNARQWGFDERQQKTNMVRFQEFNYNGLLLGSSRSTYIDQNEFAGQRVFNYSASGMRPSEFNGYLAFAERRRGQPLQVVYLGLDFFSTNLLDKSAAAPPSYFIGRSDIPFYRLDVLLNYSTFKKSLRYIRDSRSPAPCDCYNRWNVKDRPRLSPEQRDSAIYKDVEVYRKKVYGKYEYDKSIKHTLEKLKSDFGNTKFVPFITPVSRNLFDILIEQNRMADYERWLAEIVDVFGSVFDFSGVNSITTNLDNYADGHHFYPSVGALIANRLTADMACPSDFGIYVTKHNLKSHVFDLMRQAHTSRAGY